MRIYGGLNSDAYSGAQQWIEVAGAQGLLSSIFFFSTVKPVLSGRHLGMAYWPLNTVKVWKKWELLKKMEVVKERIIHPTTNWRSPVSTSSWAKRKKLKTTWRHTQCDLLHYNATSSHNDRVNFLEKVTATA